MKRGAEKQLVRDMDEDEEAQEVVSGFKKADDAVLASRPMRGMPKRTAPSTPTPTPSLNGSSGLGGQSFTGFGGFGSTPAPQPKLTPDASDTAKYIASLVGGQPQVSANAFSSTSTTTSTAASKSSLEGTPEYEYYRDLRGLNACFSAFLDSLSFEDALDVMDQYKAHRLKVEKKYEQEAQPDPAKPAPAPSSSFSMPKPPTGGFSFGGSSSASAQAALAPSTNGSGFGFKPATSTPAADTTASSSSLFSFAKPTTSGTPSEAPPPSNPFAFGTKPPNAAGGTTTNPFSFATPPKSTDAASSPFSLGQPSSSSTTSFFGADSKSSSTSNAFTFGASNTSKAETKSATSLFGNPDTTSKDTGSSTPSPPKPPTFGSFSGFGSKSPSGSIGNPIGFGFGSPSPAQTPDASKASTPFSFGAPPKAEVETSVGTSDDAGGATNASRDATPAAFGGPNPHDEEGEGEEDEETIHQVRSKALVLSESKDGTKSWKDLGVGFLRIKRHKETSATRVLLRNSSTGKINVNFVIYNGIKPTASQKSVTVMGHDEGVKKTYALKVANSTAATELQDQIKKAAPSS